MSEAEKGYYVRFSPYHRISHFIMMTTFIMCALTGPPLKYSYDFWAQGLMSFWGEWRTQASFTGSLPDSWLGISWSMRYSWPSVSWLSLIHISEPTRRTPISYAV